MELSGAKWIWAGGEPQLNQYVEFRHEFDLESDVLDGELLISVDSNYAVWLNGSFVGFGQYHDYPEKKTCDTLPVSGVLRRGRNVLCVLGYYQGEGSFQYIKGTPGLVYVLRAGSGIISSGSDTVCRVSRAYPSGSAARITAQLGFTFQYDARQDDGWTAFDYVPDSSWRNAVEVLPRDLSPRPIGKLEIGERLRTEITAQGVFRRESSNGTVAEVMQTDHLSHRNACDLIEECASVFLPSESGLKLNRSAITGDGAYFVIDLGREEAGILELDLEADEGTIVDIAWGEHLADLRVRAHIGGRNFASRYIARGGRQRFTHYFTRLAGRYIELHISGIRENFALHYAGLRPTDYPIEVKGSFECSDSLYNRIHDVSVRTLHLCMHEHYEDCPWREQSLYAMDSRNQALCGYYCFGEYDFPAASFDLLGRGLKDDGFLALCSPAEIPITIPSFTYAWIIAVADHLLYSGRTDLAEKSLPAIRKIIDTSSGRMNEGLLPCPNGKRYWQFYDWSEGLDGTVGGDCREWDLVEGERFDAPLNLFFCLALDAAAVLAEACGDTGFAKNCMALTENIRTAIQWSFWSSRDGGYMTSTEGPRHFAELTQSLAILAGVCSGEQSSALRQRLASSDNGMIETTLSHSLYKFEALMQEPEKFGPWVFEKIARDWGHMLMSGATSFWETLKGRADFDNAGSLCHGWSGVPVYFYQAYLLGIRPLEPGFRRFVFDPVRNVVPSASGVVPTPYGPILVEWEKLGESIAHELKSPDGTTAVILPQHEGKQGLFA